MHPDWGASVKVVHLDRLDRYYAEVCIICTLCEVPMRFIGLPVGFMMNLPTCSADGVVASLPCHPIDEMMPEEKVKKESLELLVVDGNTEEH